MSNEVILSNLDGVIEIQDEGTGGGSRNILDLASDIKGALTGVAKGFGSINREYRVSARTNTYVPRPVRRDPPDPISPSLTMKAVAANYLEQFDSDSRFAIYVRHVAEAKNATLPLSYERVDILNDVALGSLDLGDLTIGEGSEGDREITAELNAASHTRVLPVEGVKLSTGFASADDTNVTAVAVDSNGDVYAVTAADGVGTHPFLLKFDKSAGTWSEIELSDLTADCSDIAVAGDYLIVSATTTIAIYDKSGTLIDTTTAAQNIAALCAIDAGNIVAVGASGLVMFSENGGSTWSTLTSGVATSLVCVEARDINEWYIGGASGTLLRYYQGTISSCTLPTALAAATVNCIALPDSPAGFNRDEDIYIGATTGDVYKSQDNSPDATGDWTQVVYPGDGSGSVVDLKFTEFLGQVLYILQNTAGGSAVLYRDWSGGAGGINNAESVTVPTNSGMAEIVPINANEAFVVGDVHSGAEMVIHIEA